MDLDKKLPLREAEKNYSSKPIEEVNKYTLTKLKK